jgi:hypothetical protein
VRNGPNDGIVQTTYSSAPVALGKLTE